MKIRARVEIKSHWIRQYLNEDLHYNYKRGSDRNTRAKDPSSIHKQAKFAVVYLIKSKMML